VLKKSLFVFVTLASLSFRAAFGDSTNVNLNSGSFTLTNSTGTPLSGGSTNDGNGDVLQLGYFSTATAGSVFSGSFVPLSGQGSPNNATVAGSSPAETYNQTSIGDINTNANGNGTYALTLTFVVGSGSSGNNLPSGTPPLAIEFYNATTIGAATEMNAVSDASWLWITPATPQSSVSISLNDTGLQWLDLPSSAFKTEPIPEPATYAFLGLGLPLLLRRVRRKLRLTLHNFCSRRTRKSISCS